ncbi:MAG: hypothetical protein LC793_13340 [Thermomicrobia bacterium]|nr:hypothetical protein [Thermomicrobia bacterium]
MEESANRQIISNAWERPDAPLAEHVEPDAPLPTATRLSVVALVAVGSVGAVLLFVLGYLARHGVASGSVAFTLRAPNGWKFWLPGLLLALVIGAVIALLARRDEQPELPSLTAALLPTVTLISGLLVIAVYHDRRWWFVAPVVAWLAILVGAISRLLLIAPEGFTRDVARTSLTVVTYVIGFIALAMIYINKYRSIFSASAVTIIAFLLLLQMTDGEHVSLLRRIVYAVVGALIVGQVTWVINYWSATGWTGGAFLLAIFYLIAGLSGAQLRDRIQAFDVVEFGGVALIAIAIVSAAVWYQA